MRGSKNLAELREPWIPAYAGNDKKRYSATAPDRVKVGLNCDNWHYSTVIRF